MTSLTWQTLLLLGITYFAGCCLGCLGRRAAWRRRAQVEAATAHAAAMAGAAAVQPVPERTAVPMQPVVARAAPVAAPQPTAREPFRRADALAPAPKPAQDDAAARQDTSAAARFQRTLEAGGMAPQPEAAEAVAAGPEDDLKRIKGIDAALEAQLKALGTRSYADMASWTAADLARISRELGFKGRIEQENWIEQAQMLARGDDTRHARRLARGETAAARPIEDEGEPRAFAPPEGTPAPRQTAAAQADQGQSETGGEAASAPEVSERAAFAERRPAEPEAMPPVASAARAPVRATADDLKRVRGVTDEIEALLNGHGVTRYTQLAGWTRDDTSRFDALIGESGRIARENWIEQAQILGRGGDTAFSRDYDRRAAGQGEAAPAATAPPAPVSERGEAAGRAGELAVLRSVRSQAYRAAEGAAPWRGAEPAQPDDLKRIRGIGLLIEKRLNGLGVTTYEHIANWTAADIERVSQVLDFKGRIERENWVEQARILTSGGQTEFSRRIDRSRAAQRAGGPDPAQDADTE